MRERWFIDGWEVTQGYFRDVEVRDGLLRGFAPQGGNTQVSNRPGRLWQRKDLDEGKFSITFWLTGETQDRAAVEAAWDDVLRVVVHPERLLFIQRHTASGEVRECMAEVTGEMSPRAIGQQAMRAALEFTIPDGYWRSQDFYTEDNNDEPIGGNTVLSLPGLAPSTAPVTEAVFIIKGPVSNPRVAVPSLANEWFQYTGNVPAGLTLTVDCRDWSVEGYQFTANPAALTHGGDGPYLTIPVSHPGEDPQILFTGLNTTSQTRLTVTAQRAYLS